ncbi:MAG: hypothetical protein IRZ07_30835 [Microbispora sp.]|nr:hypothetical protein [Microbispora sp.]
MKITRINLDLTGQPHAGAVRVDDIDISNAVYAVTVRAAATEVPTVTLDLRLPEILLATEAEVRLPDATRDALIALGWTPPADTPPGDAA